ncbi:histidine kinase [Halobacillus salinarum]|uniref:histidine kinase n=1 Tax=Halobacillus salinarum TaxID=2932257 RepID=A0ABY4EKB4_9BACI|nr:histidine kinase [Halobacillus salinarum]UOQ44420.1 histidine kinase [Halobacillus salinarum]
MNKIQTKLMAFFFVLILLMNGIAYFLYQGSQDNIRQYDHLLERFFLLNDVEQTTTQMFDNMTTYMIKNSPDSLDQYNEDRTKLRSLKIQLAGSIDRDQVVVENYSNMLASFLEETKQALDAYQSGQIERYSSHTQEAASISGYIQDTTLTLINNELSDYESFYHSLVLRSQWIEKMGISIFIFTLFASLLFAFWFSRDMTRPIHRLSKAAEEIASGDFSGPDIQVKTNDELKLLTETFNGMRNNIRSLIQQMKQKSEMQQLMKEMELKSLQSQVNPHFLFNTLNLISKSSYIEEAHRTGELIESVSAMLRYNLSRLDEPTTFKDELKSIKEYVFIQKARFGSRFTFNENIALTTWHTPLPVLTLQPLIENAFIHGIENKEEGGEISVISYETASAMVIEVIDDGTGMTSEQVKQWNDVHETAPVTEGSGHTTGIGLFNVIRRIEMMYEQKGLVKIKSREGKGTTIQINLPIRATKEEKESSYEVADC